MTPAPIDAPTPVLYLSAATRLGGAEISLLTLLRHLDRDRFQALLACPPGTLADTVGAELLGEVHRMPFGRPRTRAPWTWPGAVLAILQARRALRGLIESRGVHLVHANGPRAALHAAPTPTGPPRVLHLRDRVIAWPVARMLRGWSKATVVPARGLAEMARGRLASPVAVIPNGVDDRFTPEASPPASPAPRASAHLIMVAHLVPWKRHDIFLRLLAAVRARYPEATGAVHGADLFHEHPDYLRTLQGQARALGLEGALTFAGETPAEAMPAVFRAATLLVHPVAAEPFGRAIIEAMACGTPVVALAGGGPEEILAGGGGLLARHEQGLREAVLALLADPARRAALGAAGRERALARYGAGPHAEAIEALYDDLLRGHAPPEGVEVGASPGLDTGCDGGEREDARRGGAGAPTAGDA